MSRLSDMPDQIISKIISLVAPDCIESFTSTCKRIYELAVEKLDRHRAMKQKHAVYQYKNPIDFYPCCRPSQLLEKVLQEPQTAMYVQELSFNNWWSTQEYLGTTYPEGSHRPYTQRLIPRLNEIVSQLVPQDEVSTWLKYIETGSEDPIISLLLLLLPNLSTLKFKYLGEGQECLHDTLCRIRKMKGPGVPLSRLRHVQIPHSWELGGLKLFELFLRLPSIRSIHATGMFTRDVNAHSDTNLAPRTSDLEDLTLTTCWIGPKILSSHLEAFKALRSFTYDSGAKILDMIPPLEFDSFWIRSGLLTFAISTLESLTPLSHNRKRDFMGSIRGFTAMRNLHTETQLLLRESDMYHDETSLARALPPNLETLKLECSGVKDETQMAELIRHWLV